MDHTYQPPMLFPPSLCVIGEAGKSGQGQIGTMRGKYWTLIINKKLLEILKKTNVNSIYIGKD